MLAPMLVDEFTRTADAAGLGTAPDGSVYENFASGGWMGMDGTRAYMSSASSVTTFGLSVIDRETSDVDLEILVDTIPAPGKALGIAYRVVDGFNYRFAFVYRLTNLTGYGVFSGRVEAQVVTYDHLSNVFVEAGSIAGMPLRVVAVGSSIDVFFNDVKVGDTGTSAFQQTATKHGPMGIGTGGTSGDGNQDGRIAWMRYLTPYPYDLGSVDFAYTGAMQTYTVPAGAVAIEVDMFGAAGGAGGAATAGAAGLGGRVRGFLPVTPGETLNIYVGGAGGNGTAGSDPPVGTAGWNGGSSGGGGGGNSGGGSGGGGGGASDIRRGGTALANRIIVAGAGGGGASGRSGAGGGAAGGGGGTTAGVGGGGSGTGGGGGGTQAAGGAAGSGPAASTAGALGVGGTAGAGFGGGAGGGYYGGGGGGGTNDSYSGTGGGGGGGSSFAGEATGVVHAQAVRAGHGAITVTAFSTEAPPPQPVAYVGHAISTLDWSTTRAVALAGVAARQAGDLAVVIFGTDGTMGTTPPAGWTYLGGVSGSTGPKNLRVFTRVLDGSDADPTFTIAGSQIDNMYQLYVFRNAQAGAVVSDYRGLTTTTPQLGGGLTVQADGFALCAIITHDNTAKPNANITSPVVFTKGGGPATPQWEANVWTYYTDALAAGPTGTLPFTGHSGTVGWASVGIPINQLAA